MSSRRLSDAAAGVFPSAALAGAAVPSFLAATCHAESACPRRSKFALRSRFSDPHAQAAVAARKHQTARCVLIVSRELTAGIAPVEPHAQVSCFWELLNGSKRQIDDWPPRAYLNIFPSIVNRWLSPGGNFTDVDMPPNNGEWAGECKVVTISLSVGLCNSTNGGLPSAWPSTTSVIFTSLLSHTNTLPTQISFSASIGSWNHAAPSGPRG